MERKKTQDSQHSIEEKNKGGGLMLLNLKTNHKATVIKTVVIAKEQTDQWNRKESLKIEPYLQSVFDKGAKAVQ